MSSRTSKKPWVLSFLVRASLGLAACGGGGQAGPIEVTVGADGMVDTSALAQDPPYTVCFSNASVSNSWRVMMNAHVDWAIEEATAAGEIEEYLYADANDDPAKQISDVEDLLTRGCDVLILSAAASDVVDPAAQAAMEAGVPVVTLDRDVADPAHRVSPARPPRSPARTSSASCASGWKTTCRSTPTASRPDRVTRPSRWLSTSCMATLSQS